jgi:glutamate-5-semialdehyde dehydrogenase
MESISGILENVKNASGAVRRLSDGQKVALLHKLADLLEHHLMLILTENRKDLDRMADSDPKKDRLMLNEARVKDLANSCRDVASLPDPTGHLLYESRADNGLLIQKFSVPVGVVGIIYESRPNVTIDVVALCIRSGNAVLLRGGSDAEFSNKVLVGIIHEAMALLNVDINAVQLLPIDRKFVKELLEAEQFVDIIIPRGSQELIDFVRLNSRVPTIETGAGVCHTYIEKTADLDKASAIVVNAKVQRPSVCNALDTIVVDKAVAAGFLPKVLPGFLAYDVEIYADEKAYPILQAAGYPHLHHASAEDFGREFLSYKCSVKVVEGPDEALSHIARYSSRHSEAICSNDTTLCERFLNEVDAAAVYANASTRFTDGGVFGLGAEIGISTQKLHARGPFALEKLTTEKWVVHGNGQVR